VASGQRLTGADSAPRATLRITFCQHRPAGFTGNTTRVCRPSTSCTGRVLSGRHHRLLPRRLSVAGAVGRQAARALTAAFDACPGEAIRSKRTLQANPDRYAKLCHLRPPRVRARRADVFRLPIDHDRRRRPVLNLPLPSVRLWLRCRINSVPLAGILSGRDVRSRPALRPRSSMDALGVWYVSAIDGRALAGAPKALGMGQSHLPA
jgi:hypothetical protein